MSILMSLFPDNVQIISGQGQVSYNLDFIFLSRFVPKFWVISHEIHYNEKICCGAKLHGKLFLFNTFCGRG